MTLKSLLIKTNVILKNIFFYLAWFLFLIAFYIGGISYIPCFIFAFVFFKIYLLIAKGDLDSDVFMQDKFYLLLKHIAFFISFICLIKIIYNFCLYDKSVHKSIDILQNIIPFAIFGFVYLYLARVYKNYKIYFKKYLALIMAILCAWWYYDDFLKQANELITRILKSELKCSNLERVCIVLDKSILDDINLKLKGKNDDEIKEILSQFDFKAKNEYFYFNKILLGKSVNIRLELKDDEVIEIMVVRF
ncbi:putative membrane protein [Campylobacter sp. RM5004]|uniref:hypothetical protein n=1 Tax=Campylobacter sp. RM5004 TaxID=1660078 RepID=UPI001EFAB1FC|nr:hypothetical protein [Campylobacter sp. RM5004]ULO02046.1 putative membrane protein [Campylobacter sp. RM5004]